MRERGGQPPEQRPRHHGGRRGTGGGPIQPAALLRVRPGRGKYWFLSQIVRPLPRKQILRKTCITGCLTNIHETIFWRFE
jgi:hypothetical protein